MGSVVRTQVLVDQNAGRVVRNRREKKLFGRAVTYPQCIPSAFFALMSLNIRTLSSGWACRLDHMARGEYALEIENKRMRTSGSFGE